MNKYFHISRSMTQLQMGLLMALIFVLSPLSKLEAQTCVNSICTYELAVFNPLTTTTDQILNLTDPGFNLDKRVKSARLYVKFSTGEDYKWGDISVLPFDFTFNFDIEANDALNASGTPVGIFNQTSQSILIDNSTPERIFYKEFTLNADNIKSFKLFNLASPSPNNSTGVTSPNLNSEVEVKIFVEIEYGVDVREAGVLKSVAIDKVSSCQTACSKVITFGWNNNGRSFTNYEIQLLRLYNVNPAKINNEQDIDTDLDWSKALTMETQSDATNLTITIAAGTGFYVWRVRPIGSFYEGNIADDRNYGLYNSSSPANGTSSSLVYSAINSAGCPSTNCAYFYYDETDRDKSFIYSRSFTEGNRVSENILYANGLQQLRQTQVHIPSKNISLITQSVLDYSGRPTLSTLPVPLTENNFTGYKETVISNSSSGTLYTADDFDKGFGTGDNYKNPDAVDAGGLFDYYSNANTGDITIPNAEGFPFKRSLFHNDGTDRVKEQSGVGKVHTIGQQTDGSIRTVRTLYGTPSDEELIRVFGDEAPDHESVLTTIKIDANNTSTITYTSKRGHIIATCISFDDTDNILTPLDNESATSFVVGDVLTQNVETENGFVSSKRLALAKETSITIDYSIPCANINLSCGSTATVDCGYDVFFVIHSLDGVDISAQGGISTAANFPTLADVVVGWSFIVSAAVTDNDGSKTNTGQSFGSSDEITWIGSGWVLTGDFLPNTPVPLQQLTLGSCTGTPSTRSTPTTSAINLPAGTYIIEKHLVPTDAASIAIEQNLEFAENTLQPIVDLITFLLSDVETADDFADFCQDMEDFVTDLNTAIGNAGSPSFSTTADAKWANFFDGADPDFDLLEITMNFTNCTNVQIISPCCTLDVPIEFELRFKCYGTGPADYAYTELDKDLDIIALGITPTNVSHVQNDQIPGLDFEGYANAFLSIFPDFITIYGGDIHTITTDPNFPPDLIPGYGDGEINELFYNMISDNTLCTPYTCEEIWECWIAQIQMVGDLVFGDNETGAPYNVSEASDADSDDDETVHDDHFDDNFDGVFFLVKWIAKNKVSKKMRNLSADDFEDDDYPIEYEFNAIAEFLECTGYRFTDMIIKNPITCLSTDFDHVCTSTTSLTDNLGVTSSYCTPPSDFTPNIALDADNEPILPGPIEDKLHPYKYFVYEDNSDPLCELIYCYLPLRAAWLEIFDPDDDRDGNPCNDSPVQRDGGNEVEYCGFEKDVCDGKSDYTSWNCAEREQFFRCIKDNVPTDEIDVDDDGTPDYDEEDDTKDCAYYAQLVECAALPLPFTEADAIAAGLGGLITSWTTAGCGGDENLTRLDSVWVQRVLNCRSTCESRRGYFEGEVKAMFSRRCYVFEECITATTACENNVVPQADIDAIVDQMVEDCKAQCTITSFSCDDNVKCVRTDNNETHILLQFIINDACEELHIEQSETWTIEMDIVSKCEDDYVDGDPCNQASGNLNYILCDFSVPPAPADETAECAAPGTFDFSHTNTITITKP